MDTGTICLIGAPRVVGAVGPHPFIPKRNLRKTDFRDKVILRVGRPDHDQQHYFHHATKVKPETATAVVKLLMMGVRTPETC
jgi:hypothetical protein